MIVLQEIHLEDNLNSLTKKYLNKKTEKHNRKIRGIYFLFNKDFSSELVYIGISSDIYKRIETHRDEGYKKFTHFICFEINKNQKELFNIESKQILKYIPKYNKSIPPNKLNVITGNSMQVDAYILSKDNGLENGDFNCVVEGFLMNGKIYITKTKTVNNFYENSNN